MFFTYILILAESQRIWDMGISPLSVIEYIALPMFHAFINEHLHFFLEAEEINSMIHFQFEQKYR